MGGARSKKTAFVRVFRVSFLRTAYRKQFYPKPIVPMESRDSEGHKNKDNGDQQRERFSEY